MFSQDELDKKIIELKSIKILDSVRARVFKVITIVYVIAPLIGESANFFGKGYFNASLSSSLVLCFSSLIIYFWYLWTKKYYPAVITSAILQLFCFSWGLFLSGGIRAEQFFYFSCFPVVNGFLLGKKAAFYSAFFAISFTLFLAFLEYVDFIPFQRQSLFTVSFQALACLTFISWITMNYEMERSKKENELIDLAENYKTSAQKQITKEKKLINTLDETKNFLSSVLNYVPGPVYAKRSNGKYIFVNEKFYEVVSVPPGEITQMTDFDFMPKEIAEIIMKNDQKIFEYKKSIHILEEVPKPDGSLRYYDTYKFPVFDSEMNVISVTGISFDITEKLKIEKELNIEKAKALHNAKLASLGEISAGIAHEINNPLAIISGNISLLKNFKDNEEKFDIKIETIHKSIHRITKIINGLRKFSRTTGELERKNVDLNEILQESLVLIESKIKHNSVRLEINAAQNLNIYCDSVEIEQVLVNLINNSVDAIKNLKDSWIQINAFEKNNHVILQVVDSGSGISKNIEDKLFEPFFTTKEVGKGTGLGLSISKGILDQHKASIKLNRQFKNTCFEVCFPKMNKESKVA